MDNASQNQEANNGFAGDWLTFDGSVGIQEWVTRKIVVTGDEMLLHETSGRRPPARGNIKGDTAVVKFPDDPSKDYHARLIAGNTIEWAEHSEGREEKRWFRKGSPEDPNEKLEYLLKKGGTSDIQKALQDVGKGWSLRILVNEWVQWIASGDPKKFRFIEETADKMRSTAGIVRHLVYQLSQEFQLNIGQESESKEITEKSAKAVTLKVHRRIARLLAEMSDRKYFNSDEVFDLVKKELVDHAIPVLVPRLPIEEDLEIRRDFATALGKLGRDESMDALVRAVVSAEQIRANRQEMLKEYYLEPSKKQGDQAAKILEGAVKEARKTLSLLQWLNVVVFIAGMAILVGGLFVSITVENARVAGALVGIGGFAGVIGLLIRDPLNRIQNSLSNLVQLEAAFTSFIWELNLNSTYIQSQYVAEGILRDEDVIQTLNRIEGAMDFAMNQVATYTDEGREVTVPHLTHLSPMVGKAGATVHVYGNHIKVSGKTKETTGQIAVAINHIPALTMKPPEKREAVDFNLSEEMLVGFQPTGGNLWISLVINGVETNALPFRLLETNHQDEGIPAR